MPPVGVSFSPLGGNSQASGSNTGQASPSGFAAPVQDAIKLLSFRLPSQVGASAGAPGSIMGGPTALGPQIGNAIAEQWLRRLFQGQGDPTQSQMPSQVPPGAMGPFSGGVTGAASGIGGGPQTSSFPTGAPPSATPVNVGFGDGGPRMAPDPGVAPPPVNTPQLPGGGFQNWLPNERGQVGGGSFYGG